MSLRRYHHQSTVYADAVVDAHQEAIARMEEKKAARTPMWDGSFAPHTLADFECSHGHLASDVAPKCDCFLEEAA